MSIKSAMDDVEAFHVAVGQPVHNTPVGPSTEVVDEADLRDALISEEYKETQVALQRLMDCAAGYGKHRDAMVDIADGLADLIYVCIGTALTLGIPLDRVWKEVHRSNMAKVADGVKRREDGKILKPEGWTPPDVEGVMYGKGA